MARTGGGKLFRTETVSVRLDPMMSYFTELGARAQRRTKSAFIEAAIEKALLEVSLSPVLGVAEPMRLADISKRLWHVREHQRLIRLAEWAPHLMDYVEQGRWAVVCETSAFWPVHVDHDGGPKALREVSWDPSDVSRVKDALVGEHWEAICKVASGEAGREVLPKTALPK